MRSIEFVKYVQHMLTAGWLFTGRRTKERWTNTLFSLLVTHNRWFAFVLLTSYQSATYNTTLTELTCAILLLLSFINFLWLL